MTEVTGIDRRLNIVVPLDGPDGAPIAYVHAQPVSLHTFEAHSAVIAAAYTAIFAGRVGGLSGPRVAAMALKEEAQAVGKWDGPHGVERTLFAEIRRLSNFICQEGGTWESIPYEDAVRQGLINEWERSEVDNALAFFTVVSCMDRRRALNDRLALMTLFWDASSTSLTSTDFASSIKTLTTVAGSGEKETASSIPV